MNFLNERYCFQWKMVFVKTLSHLKPRPLPSEFSSQSPGRAILHQYCPCQSACIFIYSVSMYMHCLILVDMHCLILVVKIMYMYQPTVPMEGKICYTFLHFCVEKRMCFCETKPMKRKLCHVSRKTYAKRLLHWNL